MGRVADVQIFARRPVSVQLSYRFYKDHLLARVNANGIKSTVNWGGANKSVEVDMPAENTILYRGENERCFELQRQNKEKKLVHTHGKKKKRAQKNGGGGGP